MGVRAEWANNQYRDRGPEENKILETEFDMRFVSLMQAAMSLSFYKYGALAAGVPEKTDSLKSLEKRIQKYRDTGNVEWLVDVANFAMMEFMHPAHPLAHYRPTDSHETPGIFTHVGSAAETGSQHEHRFLETAFPEEIAAKFPGAA
jgi:hypothetical protein